ncbi:MAG TPA: PA domain-containing protein, partial [Bacteroidales bacterium]|nr:PA domain-containing protein [Bacteroidales bacterium]
MKIRIIIVLLFSFTCSKAQKLLSPEITIADLKHYMYYLASDSLSGRFPGSPGGNAAASYIANNFKKSGVTLFQKNGFQNFDVLTRQETGKKNLVKIDGVVLKINKEFAPFPFSENAAAKGEIVFAGYGLDIKTDSFQWNDYASIDVKGKIVMLLRGSPESEKYESLLDNYSDDIVKAINARDKGATAILFVSGNKYDPTEKLPQMNVKESSAGIPVFQIRKALA